MLKENNSFNKKQESFTSFYEFESLPKFPISLFRGSEYRENTALKVLSAFFLAVATLYFLFNFWEILASHIPNYYGKLPGSSGWQYLLSTLGQLLVNFSEMAKLVLLMIPLVFSYLFAWIVFETRLVAQYALGIVNIVSGGIYVIDPVDAIPDFLPVAGNLDDVFFGLGWAIFGVCIFLQAIGRGKDTENVLQLINENNEEKALQMLLKDKGIQVRKTQRL